MTAKRVVHKYPLAYANGPQPLGPANWSFVHAGLDGNGQPAVWLEVDPTEAIPNDPTEQSYFHLIGTGHEIPHPDDDRFSARHHGTFVDHAMVWHVYSVPSPETIAKHVAEEAEQQDKLRALFEQLDAQGQGAAPIVLPIAG